MFSWRENVRNGVVVKLRVLLGSHTYSVRDLRNGRRVCLSRVRSLKLCEMDAKFRHLYRKSWSESKNMTSDFVPEVAKYPKTPKQSKLGSR